MSLVTVTDLHKSFGTLDLLKGVSFFLTPRAKTGLVGPNGVGKTTLLRLLLGELLPDAGRVTYQPNARVAQVAQDPLAGDARTVLEAAQRPTRELQETWEELLRLEAAALGDDAILDQYDAARLRYQDLGGYDCENRAREILAGLGFPQETWDRPVPVLSGGERTRLALVQILVIQPDLLLLDEPTNHVDWGACEWLQEYLRRYPGAALIVSHDRFFLDEVADEILELERGSCRTYRGNYSEYRRRKAAEQEQAEEAYRRQQAEIARQQEIIQRLRSHRNYSAMHSREREVERLTEQARERPRDGVRSLRLKLGAGPASGSETLLAHDLEFGYGERSLFSGVRCLLERGERLAIVGPNGAGKSTLLRVLAGQLASRRGAVEYGFRVRPAYFAQDLSSLDPEATVWETIWETGALDNQQTVQALHQFLFMGDALSQTVANLSGGEQTRLALCRLLTASPNLLLLDEPTNHLDIASREAVERALRNYPGTVVVVSHDRYFLQGVATRILELDRGGHRFFAGSFAEYRSSLAPSPAAPGRKKNAPAPARPGRTRPVPLARQVAQLEAEIARQEARGRELERLLALPATWSDPQRSQELSTELNDLTEALQMRYEEWASLSEAAQTEKR